MRYVSALEDFGRDDVATAGGKAANLGELARAGFPVPPGFVVTTAAYRQFERQNGLTDAILQLATTPPSHDPGPFETDTLELASQRIQALFTSGRVDEELRSDIITAYQELGAGAVAVRSSATAEDLLDASFAGQQDTYLNVSGPDALLRAVVRCWASLWTARALAYRRRQGIPPAEVSLAVLVQQLVDAEAAGVMFTANPANGRLGEVVIAAAWGLGESVVSGAVNTDDLVLDSAGRVLSRQTADKAVRTVGVEGGTEEQAVPSDSRLLPVLDDQAAARLARLGVEIDTHFGTPQDIEWARVGDEFSILQSRPITALPLPEAEPPTDWSVPDRRSLYVRASLVEQLPDPLSPLFADLIDSSVSRSLRTLIKDLVGHDVLRDGDVSMPTVNGYAYYAYTRAGMRRMMLQSVKPLVWLMSTGLRSGSERWRTYSRPRYQQVVQTWTGRELGDLPADELTAGVRELLDAGTEYYTAVQTIIPMAASSEVLLTRYYSWLVRARSDPPAIALLLGFDSLPILADKSLYDVAQFVRQQQELLDWLLATSVQDVVQWLGEEGDGDPEWTELRARLHAHLARFGHMVYNLDFVNAVPADDPAPLIDTLGYYLRGEGADPYQRQQSSRARREDAMSKIVQRLDPVRRWAFVRLLRWAQSAAPLREDALADVGLAWPQLRRLLAELGRRLVEVGAIETVDDVCWLRWHELKAALSSDDRHDGPRPSSRETIASRQELWRGRRRATPPQLLPQGTWLDRLDRFMPATSAAQTGNRLKGIGASGGRVSGVARVLAGPQDFSALGSGEILVAAITTPAWTPLFARAAAVVTDIGGPLSHSSIVAREYGIPAVLGTGVGSRRIRSGQRITVDGDAGTVTLLEPAS